MAGPGPSLRSVTRGSDRERETGGIGEAGRDRSPRAFKAMAKRLNFFLSAMGSLCWV